MANDLVVQLGAKLDQFSKDMNQAGDIADSAVSRIESSFASLNPGIGLGGLAGIATGAAASVGLLLAALQTVNKELADISKNAEFVGVSVERLQQLQFAATQGGVGSDQAITDLRKVASLLADAKENENSLTKLLDANNIKYKDRNGTIITTNQLLTIAGDLINRFTSMPEKTKAAEALGLSEKWVAALHDGSKAFEAVADSADAAGVVIDKSTIAKAEAFDKAWEKSSATLRSQFKAVTGDIAGFFDDLIDKAAEFIKSTNAAKGTGGGSGQEKFNAIADSIAISARIDDGTASVKDLERAIEIIAGKDKAVPQALFDQLIQLRIEAAAAAKEVEALNRATSQSNFPAGVPLPQGRPSSANDPAEDAARLAKRKQETNDQFDRAQETIAKHTAKMEADTQSVGKGAAAQEELRAEAQLLTAAQLAGIPVTGKTADLIQDLAQDAGIAAEALAKAKTASEIKFGAGSAFLTQEDVSIAQKLRGIYGDDIPAALASSEAAALRVNDASRQIATTLSTNLTTGIVDVIDHTKSAGAAFADFAKIALRAIEETIIKLTVVGPLMRGLQSGLGGLFGFGAAPTAGAGGLPAIYAEGGAVSGPGGPTSDSILARLSDGEFVVNAAAASRNRRLLEAINSGTAGFATGGLVGTTPNDVVSGSSGPAVTFMYAPQIDARGVDARQIGQLAVQQAKFQRDFERNVQAVVGKTRQNRPGAFG